MSLLWVPLLPWLSPEESLRFASYYGDHMVLQKAPERAVVWGYGPEGEQVNVTLWGPEGPQSTPPPVTVTQGERGPPGVLCSTRVDHERRGGVFCHSLV